MTTATAGAKVFVVGAGPSGLAAAWRLRQAGCEVTILEGRDRVGGQLLTIQRDGFLIEAATTILPAAYESVMGLVREADLSSELVPASSLIAFVRDGKHHYLRADHLAVDAVRSKLLSPWSKAKVGRFALDMARVRRVLSYEDLSVAGAFDSETPEAYAVRRGLDGELYDYFIEPIVRAGAGVPANVISVVEFFFLAQKVLGTQLFAFKHGYSSFARRLAEGFDVVTGATVRQIVERGDGVEVTWDGPDGAVTQSAAGAVISSMGNRVPDMLPQLTAERADFLRALNYTSCITFSLGLSRPPTGDAAFVVAPRPVSQKVFAAILEHHKAPGRVPPGKGLVTMYGMNAWSERHMETSDEDILRDAIPDSEKLVPGLTDAIEFSMVHRWYPVLVYSHPGLYRALGRFHASRPLDSRIHLAGSYNSSSNVNTATVAGERAARELVAALSGQA
jgi:oxygen-dependent protoporphyrinogen oxidase